MCERLIILSGPASIGKGPSIAALNRFYSEIQYKSVPVIKSKESRPDGPRPDERDRWDDPDFFRPKGDIERLKHDDNFIVGGCRGFPQALDLRKIREIESKIIFIEVYHTIGAQLLNCDYLKNLEINTIFLSPLSKQEIEDLKCAGICVKDYVVRIMLHKQLVRARFHGKRLSDRLLSDIVARAEDAFTELQRASKYSHVIVNHDGEGSSNWHQFPNGTFYDEPEGDAKRTMDSILRIFCNTGGDGAEYWEESLI